MLGKLFRKDDRNSTIDALRLIAAFLVVYIHSGFHGLDGKAGVIGTFLLVIGRLAVPFFFAVSGYFIFSRNYSDQVRKIQKSVPKLLCIFLLASLLYFVFYVWYFGSYSYTASLMTPETIYNMIVFNRPIYNEALWFLLALAIGSVVLWINAKYIKKDGLMLLIAVCFYAISLVVSNYSQAIHIQPVDVMIYRNFLGEGLLFILIGYMSAKYKKQLSQINPATLFIYSFICIALYIIEFYVIKAHVSEPADTYILLPLIILLIMAWTIKYPGFLKKTSVPALGASLALYIYVLHILFLYTISYLYDRVGIDGAYHIAAALRVIFAFALSLLVGYCYINVKQYIKTRYLS